MVARLVLMSILKSHQREGQNDCVSLCFRGSLSQAKFRGKTMAFELRRSIISPSPGTDPRVTSYQQCLNEHL